VTNPPNENQLDRLVTVKEIAVRAGVSSSAVCNWTKRDLSFPEPLVHRGQLVLYWWPSVYTWLSMTGRWT